MYARGFSWTFKASDPDHGFESITFVNAQTCLKDIATVEQCAVHPSSTVGGTVYTPFREKSAEIVGFLLGESPSMSIYMHLYIYLLWVFLENLSGQVRTGNFVSELWRDVVFMWRSEYVVTWGEFLLGAVADGFRPDITGFVNEPHGLPLCPGIGRCIAKPQAARQWLWTSLPDFINIQSSRRGQTMASNCTAVLAAK